jgi:excinuclease UvrABC nuclease subunit
MLGTTHQHEALLLLAMLYSEMMPQFSCSSRKDSHAPVSIYVAYIIYLQK